MDFTLPQDIEQRKLKFIVLGDSDVGKNWQGEKISQQKTRGVEIFPMKQILEGDKFLVEFIEIEGEFDERENFEIFLEIFSEESSNFQVNVPFHGIIFLFESNNKNSLESMKKWIKWFHNTTKNFILQQICDRQQLLQKSNITDIYEEFLKIPILFIGNKYDLLSQETRGTLQSIIQGQEPSINRVDKNIQAQILSTFSFKDSLNFAYISYNSNKEDYDCVTQLIQYAYCQAQNIYQKNQNFDNQLIHFENYQLKDFLYLKTFNFNHSKSFFEKIKRKIFG